MDDRSVSLVGGDASAGSGIQSSGMGGGLRQDASSVADAKRDVSVAGDVAGGTGTDGGSVDPATDDDGGDMVTEVPPSLSIDPAIKDFNVVVTGVFAEAAFQVSNTGGQPTSVPAVDLDGTNADLFSISANTCTAALLPGASCVVSVRFTPTAAGPKNARLNVTATLGGAVSASLQGLAVAPGALTMTPTTQAFGSTLQATQTAPIAFTIKNTGGTPTGVLSTSLGGSTEFVVAVDGCNGKSLAASATCTVTIAFAPGSSGPKSGTLVVSAMPGGTASSSLTGVGLGLAALAIRPATGSFPSTVLGATSASQSFTVTNSGGVAAGTTTALAVTMGGTNASDFVVSTSTCMGPLAAGASCTVSAAFKPTATGARTGNLVVTATPGSTASAPLAGTGLSAAALTLAAASGSSIDFGTVVVGSPEVGTFVVTNPGQQASTALTIAVSGAGFSVSTPAAGDCVSGTTTLGPGQSCTIHVSLAPAATGAPTGTLTASAMIGGSGMLALRGTAVSPGALTVTPATQTFAALLPGALGTPVNFTVTNTGGAATGTLTVAITRSTEFAIVTDACGTKTLAPAATCAIGVRFAPASAGQKTGSLTVSGTPGGTASAALTGTAQAPASLSIAPTTLSFADTVAGASSAAQTVTVTNNGDVAAGTTTALASALSGTNATEFAISSNTCSTTLAAHASCTLGIAFRPSTASTSKRATLTVSAAPGSAPTVALSGNGLAPASLRLATASGSSLEFGSLVIGMNQLETFVVSNPGQQSSSALTVSLPSGTDFSLVAPTGTDCVSSPASNATTLAPSATCTVRVRFAPTAPARSETATISVSAGTGGSASLTGLHGAGVAPGQLSVSPPSINFGSILQGGRSATSNVTVTNTGGVATGALTTTLPGGEFGATDGCRGVALAPNASCAITLSFSPTSASGSATGTLTVAGNPGGTQSVSLMAARSALSIAPASFTFPTTAAGATSASRSFVVTNPSSVTSSALTTTRTGTNPNDFFIESNTCAGTLGASGTCTVLVSFRPASTGARSASLTVSATIGGTASAALSGSSSCPAGFGDCNASVAGCETPLNTSTNCRACGAVCSGATPDCSTSGSGNACICASPRVTCGTICTDTTSDLANCGTCGNNCAQPNAIAHCSAGACANTCIGGNTLTACGVDTTGRPSCSEWDFESNDSRFPTEGWMTDSGGHPATELATYGPLSISSAVAIHGTRALAVPVTVPDTAHTWVVIRVPLCSNGQAVDMTGKSIGFNVRFVTAAASPNLLLAAQGFTILYPGPTASPVPGERYSPIPDVMRGDSPWNTVSGDILTLFGSTPASTNAGLMIEFFDTWKGTIYVDDFKIF